MSSLGTKSVINIIEALIEKKTDPCELEKLVCGSTANKKSGKLLESLTGNMKEHHRQQLEWKKEEYDLFEKQIEQCIKQMERICSEHFCKEMELLKSIPGVGDTSAMIIIAETGGDMNVFENSGKMRDCAREMTNLPENTKALQPPKATNTCVRFRYRCRGLFQE
jgi:hypothetical protein